jgi:hypothetical protein
MWSSRKEGFPKLRRAIRSGLRRAPPADLVQHGGIGRRPMVTVLLRRDHHGGAAREVEHVEAARQAQCLGRRLRHPDIHHWLIDNIEEFAAGVSRNAVVNAHG